ncbi:hypothetical protein [Algoriphagus litoralis]|uniref:hypothetical protein n=1 Tax=Algoriphagus litoralis TaxID=2202829 RepID=UPI000DB98235|nr:hypothetical protein [Algoriphagus litoralis]
MIFGYFDFLLIGLLIFLNIKFWKKQLDGNIGCFLVFFLFGILIPLVSQIIEVHRISISTGIIDSFEILYTFLRFPIYWLIGILQTILISLKKQEVINKSFLNDLKKAELLASKSNKCFPSGKYLSAKEFHKDLVDEITKFEKGDSDTIDNLWRWFAPTCQWDDYVGEIDLGEKIFQKLNHLKNLKS